MRRWRGYWLLWQLSDVLAEVAFKVQKWAFLRAIQYATSCYVTGGPVSCKQFLDKNVPPKAAEG